MPLDCTQLWYDGKLMNEITSASKFKTMPNINLSTPENREKAARIQMDGWIHNAGYDRTKFKIVHTKTQPIVLSKMTQEIIRKSREKIDVF